MFERILEQQYLLDLPTFGPTHAARSLLLVTFVNRVKEHDGKTSVDVA